MLCCVKTARVASVFPRSDRKSRVKNTAFLVQIGDGSRLWVSSHQNARRYTSFAPYNKSPLVRWWRAIETLTNRQYRLVMVWNHSYHDADFSMAAIFGPALRHPMPVTKRELIEKWRGGVELAMDRRVGVS